MSLERILRRTALRKSLGIAIGQAGHSATPAGFPGVSGANAPPTVRCFYRSEDELTGAQREAAKLPHGRKWYKCSHPEKPLGEIVCPCKGCGASCRGYSARDALELPVVAERGGMRWTCGLTTVPSRRDDLLPMTLLQLRKAGFPDPRLFVDGCDDERSWRNEFGLEVTGREPPVRGWPNWLLGLTELFLRDPLADRYAMFQDDFVTCRNVRAYLEACPYPERAYLNLFSFMGNEDRGAGWVETRQTGRGAVALVFDRNAVVALLSDPNAAPHTWNRLTEWYKEKLVINEKRGYRAIDGGVVGALNKAGVREFVHNPSLVQHVGLVSVIGNSGHPPSRNFVGENFDALSLLAPVAASKPV